MDIFKRWNTWQDVGIEYIQHNNQWVVIQTRTRKKDNLRQIRHVQIMRWGGQLSEKTQESLNKILGGNNEQR
jgi:hypothetical protein